MFTRYLCLAVFLSLLCLPAQAQVSITATTSGTIARDSEIPGIVSATAGTPYTLQASTFFSDSEDWVSWPNWIDARPSVSTVVLTLGGVQYEFYDSSGWAHLSMRNETVNGITYRQLFYGISMPVAGTQDSLSFVTRISFDPVSGPVTLYDVFNSDAAYPVSQVAPSTGALWRFAEGQAFGPDMTGIASSASYSTTGVPLVPVPEPSVAAMLAAGFALLGMAFRQRAS